MLLKIILVGIVFYILKTFFKASRIINEHELSNNYKKKQKNTKDSAAGSDIDEDDIVEAEYTTLKDWMHYNITALNLTLYEKYSISQEYSAFIYEYLNIDQAQADNIESDLVSTGHKIFHSNLYRSQVGLFNLEIIVAKMPFVF